jgi:hypothetical protein
MRLFPEFYDNNIRLPIPISSGVLMMIGELPITPPLMFHSFVGRWWMGSGVGSCGLYRLDEVVWSFIW